MGRRPRRAPAPVVLETPAVLERVVKAEVKTDGRPRGRPRRSAGRPTPRRPAVEGEGFAALVVLERAAETDAEALLGQIEDDMDEVEEIRDPVLRQIVDDK